MRLIKKLNAKLDSNLILFNKKRLDEIITNYFKLRNQLPFVSDEGTEITLNNTIENPMLGFNFRGNSTQKTTEGYQLFQNEYIPVPGNTINADLLAGTYTIATVDGQTFNANMYFKLYDASGTIVTTSGHLTTSNTTLSFSSSSYAYYGGAGVSYITFTIDNDYKLNIGLLNATGTRKVVLVSGSTVQRNWEQYSGGIASPNLLYTQRILSSGDNGTIAEKIVNKNLWTSEWEQGSINSEGKPVASSTSIRTKDFIYFKPLQHYAITRNITTNYINVRGYDINKNYIGAGENVIGLVNGSSVGNPMNAGSGGCVIYTLENVYYLKFNDLSNDLSTQYMMVKGDSMDRNYVPTAEQTYRIPCQQPMRAIGTVRDSFVKVNEHWFERHLPFIESYNGEELPEDVYTRKNLFRTWTNGTGSSKGITYTWNSDGTLTLNGTATGEVQINYNNTQKIQGGGKCQSIRVMSGTITSGSISFVNYTSNYSGTKTCGVTSERLLSQNVLFNVEYAIFRVLIPSGAILDNVTIALQIEESSEATEWVPYSTKYCNDKSMSTTGQFSTGASVQYVDENNWNMLPCTKEQIAILEKLPETYSGQTNIYSLDETPAYIEASGIYDTNDLVTRVEVLESLA